MGISPYDLPLKFYYLRWVWATFLVKINFWPCLVIFGLCLLAAFTTKNVNFLVFKFDKNKIQGHFITSVEGAQQYCFYEIKRILLWKIGETANAIFTTVAM